MRRICPPIGRRVALVNGWPDGSPLRPDEVEVRMLGDKDQVGAVRALAADMALRADFDLDTIEDIRLAVEEACATMVANTHPVGELVCRLLISPSTVEIAASVPVPDGRRPTVGQFSLRVLRTLSDSVDFWTTRNGDFHVQLTKSVN
jgi:serine/threonine-protein kinase RsbW